MPVRETSYILLRSIHSWQYLTASDIVHSFILRHPSRLPSDNARATVVRATPPRTHHTKLIRPRVLIRPRPPPGSLGRIVNTQERKGDYLKGGLTFQAAMGKERVQGLLLFMAFVLVLSFTVLVASTVYPRGTQGECKDKESCLLRPTLGRIELVREDSLVIISEKLQKSVKKHHLRQWPTNEEWKAIIEALGNNEHPKYVANHRLIVQQIQNGSYSYSYGNDGTYHSKMYGKIHSNGNRGHASSMYFQMASGKTGAPSLHYESGFVILSQFHYLQGRDTAQWKGKERGAFFNKNPDGSYTVFALAAGTVAGSSKVTSRTMKVTESTSSIMNATRFTAQSHSEATTIFTFNGKDNDMTSALKMFVKASTPSSNKTMTIRGNANGEYPKYGPGDYVTSFNATIFGSILNSTLVSSTKGHTWIKSGAMSPTHSAALHHLNFLI